MDTWDEIAAALADVSATRYKQARRMMQISATAKGAGFNHSYWKIAGNPGVGVDPGASPGAVPTRATLGAINFLNPAAGDEARLARFGAAKAQGGMLYLVDRLYHMKGLNGTLLTAQNVDPTPTNPVNRGPGANGEPGSLGEDAEIFIEWYTATGATQRNITVNYIDEQGVARSVTTPFQATPVVGQLLPIPLASGSYGVRSVTSVQLDGTTGTAGDFGVTILRRIAGMGVGYTGSNADLARLGWPKLYTDSCLHFMELSSAGSTGVAMAEVDIARGPA